MATMNQNVDFEQVEKSVSEKKNIIKQQKNQQPMEKKTFVPPTFIDYVDFPPNRNCFGVTSIRLGIYVPQKKYRKVGGVRVAVTTPQLMTCLVRENGSIIYNAHINWQGDGDTSDLVNFLRAYIALFEKPAVKKVLAELGCTVPKLQVSNIISVEVFKEAEKISSVETPVESQLYQPGEKNLCDEPVETVAQDSVVGSIVQPGSDAPIPLTDNIGSIINNNSQLHHNTPSQIGVIS